MVSSKNSYLIIVCLSTLSPTKSDSSHEVTTDYVFNSLSLFEAGLYIYI